MVWWFLTPTHFIPKSFLIEQSHEPAAFYIRTVHVSLELTSTII
jgi:hypothetical protein